MSGLAGLAHCDGHDGVRLGVTLSPLISLRLFQWSCMDVKVRLERKLVAKELIILNCVVGEDS